MPLRVIVYESPSSRMFRRGIMAIQLLATLTIVYHLLRCGIVVHLVNFRHPFLSTPLDVYPVSQPERCCYVSFRELILSCSTFEKIDPSRVFPFFLLSCWMKISKARRQDRFEAMSQQLLEGRMDHEDCHITFFLTSRLESRDEILV